MKAFIAVLALATAVAAESDADAQYFLGGHGRLAGAPWAGLNHWTGVNPALYSHQAGVNPVVYGRQAGLPISPLGYQGLPYGAINSLNAYNRINTPFAGLRTISKREADSDAQFFGGYPYSINNGMNIGFPYQQSQYSAYASLAGVRSPLMYNQQYTTAANSMVYQPQQYAYQMPQTVYSAAPVVEEKLVEDKTTQTPASTTKIDYNYNYQHQRFAKREADSDSEAQFFGASPYQRFGGFNGLNAYNSLNTFNGFQRFQGQPLTGFPIHNNLNMYRTAQQITPFTGYNNIYNRQQLPFLG